MNANSITIYTNGVAGAPISSPLTSRLYFAAFDGHGNLYLDGGGANNGPAFLGEIAKATNGGVTISKLTVSKP